MRYKDLSVELKMSEEGHGQITGYASTFANWDDVGERPVKGAFVPHLSDFLKDGFVSIGHDWKALPIATPTQAYEDEHGLYVVADFHSTPDAQNARTVIRERMERGKSVKLSIGYEVFDDEKTSEGRLLKNIKLYEWSYVTVPANPLASLTGVKGLLLEGGPLSAYADVVEAAFSAYLTAATGYAERRLKEGRVFSDANLRAMDDSIERIASGLESLRDLRQRGTPQQAEKTQQPTAEQIRAARLASIRAAMWLRDAGVRS